MRDEEVTPERTQPNECQLAATPAEYDPVLENWPRIAACAWEGFLIAGPGYVEIDDEQNELRLRYRPGMPPDPWEDEASRHNYDPHEQVVIWFSEERQWVLGGWPLPPDAYSTLTAEVGGEALH